MRTTISELLGCIQDDSCRLTPAGDDPAERIEARTLQKIHKKAAPKRRPKLWRTAVIAAAVMTLLIGAAYAVQQLRLKNMLLAEPPAYAEGYDTNMIAVAGYSDSPEYKALAEWEEYLTEHPYTPDPDAPCAMPDLADRYITAGAWNKEDAAALDAIVEKYGLTLHERGPDYASAEELYAAVGVAPFISADGFVGGYSYQDGTFHFDGDTTVNGKSVSYQFGNYVKGTFSRVALNVRDVERYEEWDYKTACGVTVSLALGPEKATVTANMEHTFVTVNILSGTLVAWLDGPDTLTKADVEAFADMFDYAALNEG